MPFSSFELLLLFRIFKFVSPAKGVIFYNNLTSNFNLIYFVSLYSYPSQPVLAIDESVDFGNLVANSKTIAKEISLVNHGSKSGEFKIKYAGDRPIAIVPNAGTVPPKSVQMIKVF